MSKIKEHYHDEIEKGMRKFKTPKPLKLEIGVKAMNTDKIRGLINQLAGKGQTYLEVGSYQGASLIAAAHNNPGTVCIGIDNFSEFDKKGNNEKILKNAIRSYQNIDFFKGELLDFVGKFGDIKVDCFFYDGGHTYEETQEALTLAMTFLSPNAYVIVDDTNWEWVRKATQEFSDYFGFEKVFEKSTKENGDKHWWNGIQVFQRKINEEE